VAPVSKSLIGKAQAVVVESPPVESKKEKTLLEKSLKDPVSKSLIGKAKLVVVESPPVEPKKEKTLLEKSLTKLQTALNVFKNALIGLSGKLGALRGQMAKGIKGKTIQQPAKKIVHEAKVEILSKGHFKAEEEYDESRAWESYRNVCKLLQDKVFLRKSRWFYFERLDENKNELKSDFLLPKTAQKQSQFFEFPLSKFPDYEISRVQDRFLIYDLYKFLLLFQLIAFSDIEKKIYPHMFETLSGSVSAVNRKAEKKGPFLGINEDFNLKGTKPYKDFEDDDFRRLKKDAMAGMAHRYKIHLQVKPNFLTSFVEDFVKFVLKDKSFDSIFAFKVSKDPTKLYHKREENPIPIIVLYVGLLLGTKGDKNKVLNQVIHAIVERYQNVAEEIALDLRPRFNRQVVADNNLVWIAGGDGDVKKVYQKLLFTLERGIGKFLEPLRKKVKGFQESIRYLKKQIGEKVEKEKKEESLWPIDYEEEEEEEEVETIKDPKAIEKNKQDIEGYENKVERVTSLIEFAEEVMKGEKTVEELDRYIKEDMKQKKFKGMAVYFEKIIEKEGWLPRNTVYTDDFAFFKGYGFEYQPPV